MGLYVIGIGGTGAKCAEAIIQLSAIGLFTEEPIRLLFIDADETNGNLERAKSSLSAYDNCARLIRANQQKYGWLKTKIESYGVWSPFKNVSANKNLAALFAYNSLKQHNSPLGNLFDVLYSKEEREAELDVGFRGRPAIGSAVIGQVNLDDLEQEPWGTFIRQIISDASSGKTPRIFLCGSIFGGTGASGLPTIGRLIANKLAAEKVSKVKIGCLFVLPYFGFSPPAGNQDNEVYARSEQFLLNTEAALRYYVHQAQQFSTVYLLGNQNFTQVKFSIGKKTQRNDPHFIELYAGLAARQFLLDSSERSGTVLLASRKNAGSLLWSDLPESVFVKKELVNGARFAYTWLSNIAPELKNAKARGVRNFQVEAPWFTEFYQPVLGAFSKMVAKKGQELPDFSSPQEQEAIATVSSWCQDYLRWLSEIHQCDSDNIQLFQHQVWANLKGDIGGDSLSALVMGDQRDRGSKERDTVQTLKQQLEYVIGNLEPGDRGTAGLAKALYITCRL
jgi:hypothetical protein